MSNIKEKIKMLIKDIDRVTVFIALTFVFLLTYYVNVLENVGLTEWNRTFSTAIFGGISVDNRISQFYEMFFLVFPSLTILIIVFLRNVFMYRPNYKDYFAKFSIIISLSLFASYISRYVANDIEENPLIQCLIGFAVILSVIAIMDIKGSFSFADITMFFLAYITFIICLNMLFSVSDIIINIIVVAIIELLFCAMVLYTTFGKRIFCRCKNFIFIMMWLPVFIRLALEGLYILVEKGHNTQRFLTHISRMSIIFVVVALIIAVFFKNKKMITFGYIGALTSITTVFSFSFAYQYVWNYSGFANVYELGNGTVAMDTILYGKLPIVDYFSAHALHDVWTKILYCMIHKDINGVFVDPYSGLGNILAYIILFFIVRHIFDEHIAILYVLLFPGSIIGIKWISVCGLSVIMLLHIYKKANVKSYIGFWIATLVGAFYTYDEGISLGVACIVAYLIMKIIEKQWKQIKYFVICGMGIGAVVLLLYCAYAMITGIPIVSRIKEWMSVSVGSSSSWGTANFGDPSSFAFLVSYFIVPITAILLLVFVIVKYIREQKHGLLVLITIAYSLTEILFITRTIVYHNLAVCAGRTGVLLNFVHWTISLYVLYIMTVREKGENLKLFSWIATMMLVIMIEGTVVTGYLPSSDSMIISKGLSTSKTWDLRDDCTSNIGQDRIVADYQTTIMINQFKNIFDTLLKPEETFLDFANITSMYAMTGRIRPCYVGQTPSLLTDLYSQECYLNEISEYSCPLVVVGTTESSYLQQMVGVPHNIRYYKIAEYIYSRYRPLVAFNEFAIWCEKNKYDEFSSKLDKIGYYNEGTGYISIDYGYDFTIIHHDENGNCLYDYKPYHSYNLEHIPYIWANYDEYKAIGNKELLAIDETDINIYKFKGSQCMVDENGNYLAFECSNYASDYIYTNVVFFDSLNEGARLQYGFWVKPGTNQYLIRVSQDYFWNIYNIDTIQFECDENILIDDVRILEGD